MQIAFERSCASAEMPILKTIDTANLPGIEANQLRLLLDAADFFHLPATIKPPTPKPDSPEYRITIENGDKQHTVIVCEQTVPGSLKPLLDWLIAVSQKN